MSKYTCSKCNFTSSTKGNVKRHIENLCNGAEIIEDIVKLSCDVCCKEFDTKTLLTQHKKVCICKKVDMVRKNLNSDDLDVINKRTEELLNLVSSLTKTVESMGSEIAYLKSKVEKLEKSNNKIFETFTEEQVDESNELLECKYETLKTHIAKNYDDLYSKLEPQKYEEGKVDLSIRVSIIEGNNVVGGCIANENNVRVPLENGKIKELEYGKVNFVIKQKKCRNTVAFRMLKTKDCYCSKHFDPEQGVQVDV